MTKGVVYYLSHPQVCIDPHVPVPQWELSDEGRQRLSGLQQAKWLQGVQRIVSSDETKALETAQFLATFVGLSVEVASQMHENDRSSTGFLPSPEFESTADAFFAQPDISVRGWETARSAQSRIVEAIRRTLSISTSGDVLIVGHGGVGTLLKCHIRREPISRRFDQAAEGGNAGGGNVHAFEPDLTRSIFGWTAIENLD
jgi:broad specificity phosphatase PhoE